jgi:hypothetical protein
MRSFNGWGVTIVDSLDTMWIMGLYEEFDAALAIVANITFPMEPVRTHSFPRDSFLSLTYVHAPGVMS